MSDDKLIERLRELAEIATKEPIKGETILHWMGSAANALERRFEEIVALRGEIALLKSQQPAELRVGVFEEGERKCGATPKYERFPTPCQLTAEGARFAALKVGPAFSYTLYVQWIDRFRAYDVVRNYICQEQGNPFSPYINVTTVITVREKEFEHEWWLVNDATGAAFGSEGG